MGQARTAEERAIDAAHAAALEEARARFRHAYYGDAYYDVAGRQVLEDPAYRRCVDGRHTWSRGGGAAADQYCLVCLKLHRPELRPLQLQNLPVPPRTDDSNLHNRHSGKENEMEPAPRRVTCTRHEWVTPTSGPVLKFCMRCGVARLRAPEPPPLQNMPR